MAITYVEIEDRYAVKTSKEPVEISAIIGDAQPGAYLTFLDKKLKSANKPAKLGKKSEITGKRVLVSATVVDERDETNWTSVTIEVKEGKSVTTYGPYSKEASENLDTICFLIQIQIV